MCLVSGCGKALKKEPPAPEATSQADVISTFTLVGHTPTGRKKWEVQGQTADLTGEEIYLSPVTAKSFGDVELHLTAERGRFHKVSQDVYLEGDVVATTSDGARLITDSFDWKGQTETGKTSDWVTITRPGMVVVGLGGVGYPKFKQFRLDREVTVKLQGDPKQGHTLITCDGPMEVDHSRFKARFWRNVRVRDSKGVIQADRLDVALDPKTHQLERASFYGHVELTQGQRKAYARRANYWPAYLGATTAGGPAPESAQGGPGQPMGRTVLIGHPKLVMLPEPDRGGE